jgi:hypothetical protein
MAVYGRNILREGKGIIISCIVDGNTLYELNNSAHLCFGRPRGIEFWLCFQLYWLTFFVILLRHLKTIPILLAIDLKQLPSSLSVPSSELCTHFGVENMT